MKAGRVLLLLLPLLAGCGSSSTDSAAAPSVLVGTQMPVRGSRPQTVTGYGTAGPSATGAETISSAQPGQVTQIAVTPGAAVRAGQTLLRFTVAPSARSGYAQAASALTAAREQRATTAQLLAQQLATRDQLVQADKAVSDARVALAALQREGAGQAVQSLIAPFDGVVTAIAVAQGDRTQPGAALLTVARAGGIVVTVGVDPVERPRLRAGQPAALSRLSGGAPVAGHVLRIGSTLNAKTRLVDVDLAFPAGALLAGEGLGATIDVGQVSGWVVPHRAVVTAGGPARIFQVAGGKAKSVPVRILLAGTETDVVEGALDGRKPLIVDGAYQAEDGIAVRSGR